MDSISKMTPWLGAIFCLVTAGCYNITNQQRPETSQNQQIAISKQIRNVNEDGSYSFGYEADDGSLKVESREVSGNIEGTFGFVNDDSGIRRIAYSSSNTTGFKTVTAAPFREQVSILQSILKPNRTSIARGPAIIYAAEAAPKSSVVQAIPRLVKTTPTSTITVTNMTTDPTMKPLHQRHFIKAITTTTTNKPHFNSQERPVAVVDTKELPDEGSQVNHRITEDEKLLAHKRTIFAQTPLELEQTLTSMSEQSQNRVKNDKTMTGNNLRRQLSEKTSRARVDGDEHPDVYGGTLSTSRLLSTTSAPKMNQGISAFRIERPKTIHLNHNSLGRARLGDSISKYLDTETKDFEDERDVRQQQMLSQTLQGHTLEQFDQDHARQSLEPLHVRQRTGQQYLREVHPEEIIVDAQQSADDENEATTFRVIPFSRIVFRPAPNQHNLYSSNSEGNQMRYSSGLSTADSVDLIRQFSSNPSRLQARDKIEPHLPPRSLPSPKDAPQSGRMLHHLTEYNPVNSIDYFTMRVYPHKPHAPWLPLTIQPSSVLDPPLSRRDFQTLLRQLLASRFRTQKIGYPKTYRDDALYDQQLNAFYRNSYAIPISKESPNRNGYEYSPIPVEHGEHFSSIPVFAHRRPAFSWFVKQLNPIFKANHYDDYEGSNYGKRIYRGKFYNQESDFHREEVLPAPVREALLLRMLHLVIDNDRLTKPIATITHPVTTRTTYRHEKTGPVRSVQIISKDFDNEANVSDKGTI